MPQIDEMLTIEPPPARCIAGMAALVPRKTPVALTAITRVQCSRVWSPSRGPAVWVVWMRMRGSRPETPGMLHAMSSRPYVFSASATVAAHWASSRTPCVVNRAVSPELTISDSTALPSAALLSLSRTDAPCSANRRAVAAPMPDAPPVTIATLPESLLPGSMLDPPVCRTIAGLGFRIPATSAACGDGRRVKTFRQTNKTSEEVAHGCRHDDGVRQLRLGELPRRSRVGRGDSPGAARCRPGFRLPVVGRASLQRLLLRARQHPSHDLSHGALPRHRRGNGGRDSALA